MGRQSQIGEGIDWLDAFNIALRQCFLKQFFAEITISALLWGGKAAP
jgi:hypothetical protein